MATPLNNRPESKIEAATLAARLDKKVELKHTDLFNIYKLSLVIKMDNFWTYNGRKSNHIEMPVVYQVTTTHSMVKEV